MHVTASHGNSRQVDAEVAAPVAPAALVCALALYPLVAVISANAGILPLDPVAIARSTAVIAAGVVAVYWATRLTGWDPVARALWLGGIVFAADSYGALAATNARVFSTAWAASAYGAAAIALVTVVVRPWRQTSRSLLPLAVVAAVLIAPNLYKPAKALGGRSTWMPAAQQLTKTPAITSAPFEGASSRDIYYIVLDAFGRSDTLAKYYNADLSGLVGFLRKRGFTVPPRAQSNYAQTYLSLASTLNLAYVDPLVDALGPASMDRRPLQYLIDENALMTLARQRGYNIIGIGSDYPATRRLDAADRCDCDWWGLSDLEQAAVENTIFRALPLSGWHARNHRRKVNYEVEAIARAADRPGPQFVFAHIITPHPPFVFDERGGATTPRRGVSFADGDHFAGSREEYVEGYRRQSAFVAGEVMRLVDAILARPGPPPAIVVHGDHGPGSHLQWENSASTKLDERMSIFAAYYLPGSSDPIPDDVTPINGARLLSNAYLGTRLPPLRDDSFFSTWSQPYRFVPVPGF
jgi:hypothetical protein